MVLCSANIKRAAFARCDMNPVFLIKRDSVAADRAIGKSANQLIASAELFAFRAGGIFDYLI